MLGSQAPSLLLLYPPYTWLVTHDLKSLPRFLDHICILANEEGEKGKGECPPALLPSFLLIVLPFSSLSFLGTTEKLYLSLPLKQLGHTLVTPVAIDVKKKRIFSGTAMCRSCLGEG